MKFSKLPGPSLMPGRSQVASTRPRWTATALNWLFSQLTLRVVVFRGIASAAIERLNVRSNIAQARPGVLQLVIHRAKIALALGLSQFSTEKLSASIAGLLRMDTGKITDLYDL